MRSLERLGRAIDRFKASAASAGFDVRGTVGSHGMSIMVVPAEPAAREQLSEFFAVWSKKRVRRKKP